MAIKGAIFDMDGTLLDSMHVWHRIAKRYLSSKGIEITDEEENKLGKMLLEEMSGYFIENYGFTYTTEELVADINKLVEYEYFNNIVEKPGVVEFLEKLKSAGVKMCVATATDKYITEAVLERLGLTKYFEGIFTCGQLHVDKSTPDIYDYALKFLSTEKSETYVFEDTYLPITTVLTAGYPLVAVTDKWSAHRKEDISKIAKIFVDDLSTIDISKL